MVNIYTVMPKNCDEIFQKNKMSKDGVYTIDADGTGPIPEFQVTYLSFITETILAKMLLYNMHFHLYTGTFLQVVPN